MILFVSNNNKQQLGNPLSPSYSSSMDTTTIQYLYQAIYTMIQTAQQPQQKQQQQHSNADCYNLIEAINGTLWIQIVDTAIALLEPSSSDSNHPQNDNTMTTLSTTKKNSFVQDVKIHSSLYITLLETIR
jgi:hypothetical protein